MSKQQFPLDSFLKIDTPFYYYDLSLLQRTLNEIVLQASKYEGFTIHYALKANVNPDLLHLISQSGLGADCVSGGEILFAINSGFDPKKIVFAGVGKSDKEIAIGLKEGIGCFNVESLEELEVIDFIAQQSSVVAPIALRINPDVSAHTHAHITTGLSENKFGIPSSDILHVIRKVKEMKNVSFEGLHFHIGSQILDMSDFIPLCNKINELQNLLSDCGIVARTINVGGGLGVSYDDPDNYPIATFCDYFSTFNKFLQRRNGQQIHFELGRSVVAQCGSLISKVLYIKEGKCKHFCIIDAGMTDLIRPALYGAYHKIEVLHNMECSKSNEGEVREYDVVGPICESSDVFGRNVRLDRVHRGDIIAIRSAGAYGEVMASCYNCRPLPKSFTSKDFSI